MDNKEPDNQESPDRGIKISACLVVYNEEGNIRCCLESLRGAVDEIIVVHDGECQDKTLAICEEYGAKIFIRSHAGIMEAYLVFAIEQASGDWLLRIDADEFLTDDLKNNLRHLVAAAAANHISAYSFRWRNHHRDGSFFGQGSKPILFKKTDLYWLSLPHFSWQTRGRRESSAYILGHRPKDYTSAAYWASQKKWAKIQAAYILKDFKELDSFQAEEADWVKAFNFSRRYAGFLFLPFFKFLKSFCGSIIQGMGISASWRQGLYNFYLGKYLYDLVHHR